jgi:hypothetical protein
MDTHPSRIIGVSNEAFKRVGAKMRGGGLNCSFRMLRGAPGSVSRETSARPAASGSSPAAGTSATVFGLPGRFRLLKAGLPLEPSPPYPLQAGVKPSVSAPFAPEALLQRTLWDVTAPSSYITRRLVEAEFPSGPAASLAAGSARDRGVAALGGSWGYGPGVLRSTGTSPVRETRDVTMITSD